jgi:purine-cytosine permease-like protein
MKTSNLIARLDQLYEFDREPVAEAHLHTPGKFAAIFAGEHVAATEFVIGPMFVIHGVAAADLFWGLLIGNLLAVLSWAFIVAPIAVRTRLTLYWYVRKICGPGLTFIYNSANAVLYCILAGAMISVSATAIGLAFKVPTPSLTDVLPSSVGWVVLTVAIGSVVTLFAILGFEHVSRFSSVCAPWMFAIFIAGALALLPRLGEIHSLQDFWHIATTKIWNGVPLAGQEKYSFWHIMFFAWFANLAMHVGLSDMALFRFAKNWKYGFMSAFGMYPGHFLAWICSGIMVAAVAREMNPGGMAYAAAGFSGALCVVIAGWTTANPTMYRAGLALQVISPNWKRWRITLVSGLITTIVSCFPVVFMRLLDFVALYGLILMPIGAVVFAEHWLLPRLGLSPYRAEKRGWFINWAALATWIGTLLIVFLLPVHLFFKWLPGYVIAQVLYIGLCYLDPSREGAKK